MNSRGWKSTKLHLTLIAIALVVIVYAVMGLPPGEFSQLCIAVCTLVTAYVGSNTAQKFARPVALPPPPPSMG